MLQYMFHIKGQVTLTAKKTPICKIKLKLLIV